ncbi:Translin family protein [uncultured archaeon]|nr:Translin family protein [uncultured archaeon]
MDKKAFSARIAVIVKELEKREKEQDNILSSTREIIRHCSNGIKLIHAGEVKKAKVDIEAAEKKVAKFSKTKEFGYLLEQTYQEIAEARLLLAAVEEKPLPGWQELGMPFEPYLLGLCDLIGELRREMLEMLKKGKPAEAGKYFSLMSAIYDELMPVRFSNSLLPNFRKKQDVARSQVEQARSELVRATSR